MMGHRETLKSGDEYDLVSVWRRRRVLVKRHGEWAKVKRKLARRARHDARLEAARQQRAEQAAAGELRWGTFTAAHGSEDQT